MQSLCQSPTIEDLFHRVGWSCVQFYQQQRRDYNFGPLSLDVSPFRPILKNDMVYSSLDRLASNVFIYCDENTPTLPKMTRTAQDIDNEREAQKANAIIDATIWGVGNMMFMGPLPGVFTGLLVYKYKSNAADLEAKRQKDSLLEVCNDELFSLDPTPECDRVVKYMHNSGIDTGFRLPSFHMDWR